MTRHSLILCLFLISINFLVIFALPREGIIGGFEANQDLFAYQAAIFGKENYTDIDHMICSGAIISPHHVVSAAQCFIDTSIDLYELSFSVAAGVEDLNTNDGIQVLVELIYVSLYDFMHSLNDFAVLKLEDNVFASPKLKLQKLGLPEPDDSFTGRLAVVSGYGYNWVETITNFTSGVQTRVGGSSDFKMRAGPVEIVSSGRCGEWYPDFNPYKQFCAIMYSTPPDARWGICTLDTGAPLVYEGKLLGIASKNSIDCDDTVQGALYTKVKYNLSFIKDILDNKKPVNSLVFSNREYIAVKRRKIH